MKIFLSHASLDKKLAESVKSLLTDTSMGLIKVWLSSSLDGLKPGDVLWDEIHEQLQSSDKIITLITPNSCLRPWLLYESGFVAGCKGANVIPLLFKITKSDLPLPLSAYVLYESENKDNIFQLIFNLVSEVVPSPNTKFIENEINRFVEKLHDLFIDNTQNTTCVTEKDYLEGIGIKFVTKLEASEIFHRKLADPNVREVTILTYTNEVEYGSINHYRVQGKKKIIVFKRSILSDLYDQQITNLYRIKNNVKVTFWNKNKISFNASNALEEEFKGVPDVSVFQYFYDSPPTKRAYIFDDNEAIIAYYAKIVDPMSQGGSLFKGMNNTASLLVTKDAEIGRFLINELKEYIETLKPNCRNWREEKNLILTNRYNIFNNRPCISPKAVFLDMDGVLYDSLPYYVRAWGKGFKAVGIDFPEIEVYRQEGRPGRKTVEAYFESENIVGKSDEDINTILKVKNDQLISLGDPPLMKGALQLVQKIAEIGLKICVVTGSSKSGVKERIFKDFNEIIPIENIITGNDYSLGKPNPEPYIIAADKLSISPEQAIVIENAPLGIQSAVAAGTFCIAINTGILKNDELSRNGARLIYDNINELVKDWSKIFETLSNQVS